MGHTMVMTQSGDRRAAASRRLYDAECALHAARQSQVGAWIAAASDKLHTAVQDFLLALSEPGGPEAATRGADAGIELLPRGFGA